MALQFGHCVQQALKYRKQSRRGWSMACNAPERLQTTTIVCDDVKQLLNVNDPRSVQQGAKRY